jgi:hypothetical protein
MPVAQIFPRKLKKFSSQERFLKCNGTPVPELRGKKSLVPISGPANDCDQAINVGNQTFGGDTSLELDSLEDLTGSCGSEGLDRRMLRS